MKLGLEKLLLRLSNLGVVDILRQINTWNRSIKITEVLIKITVLPNILAVCDFHIMWKFTKHF